MGGSVNIWVKFRIDGRSWALALQQNHRSGEVVRLFHLHTAHLLLIRLAVGLTGKTALLEVSVR